MAIYEFKCTKTRCGRINIVSLPINNTIKKVKCDNCGSDAERIISSVSFKIKGYSSKNGYSKGEE